VDDLPDVFPQSVDLQFGDEQGRVPDNTFSGKAPPRIDPETHRLIVGAAEASGKSLNTRLLDKSAMT